MEFQTLPLHSHPPSELPCPDMENTTGKRVGKSHVPDFNNRSCQREPVFIDGKYSFTSSTEHLPFVRRLCLEVATVDCPESSVFARFYRCETGNIDILINNKVAETSYAYLRRKWVFVYHKKLKNSPCSAQY